MNRIALYLILVLASTLNASGATAAWSGDISTSDGATVVTNPETPAHGDGLQTLRELWRRGGEDDEEIFFGTIAEFLHDAEGNIYLLDGQLSEIQVFDQAGELLRTVGRQGEGPGEFQNGADMFWAPNGDIGVVQAWPGKIVTITPEGDPGATFALPYRGGGGFQSVSRGAGNADSVILAGTAWTRVDGQQMQFTYLKRYDAGGNELATYQENSSEVNFGNFEFVEENWVDFQRRWAVAADGRVAAALSFDDYRIHVWNADGSLDRIIERPGYATVKRTGQEIDRFQTMFDAFTRWNRGSTFKVSDHHQAVENIFFREDGTLWVQSGAYRWRSEEGVFTSFDVYDQEGRYLKRVNLAADADAAKDGMFFVGERIYVVTDLFDAMMARVGGDGSDEALLEAEPVSVISFEFAPQVAATP
jgi:hypothetical protein